jgi:hypothetical protein
MEAAPTPPGTMNAQASMNPDKNFPNFLNI